MYDDICYKKNFLSQVIVKVDFLVPLGGLELDLPPKLAARLSQRFPIKEPTLQSWNFQVQLNNDAPLKSSEARGQIHNFFGRNREKQLSLTNHFLTIVQSKYETYEKFSEDFVEVYRAVQEFFPDVQASRFGLRYVNLFELNDSAQPLQWDGLVHADLIASAQFFRQGEYAGHVSRLFHVSELKFDDLDLRFQFGEPNPDYPAVMKRALFALDLDAYAQNTHSPEDSIRYMEKAHSKIQQVFESSITDKLRGLLNA